MMSHYCKEPNNCRVDFWKESGKWYEDEEIVFRNEDYHGCIFKAFKNALSDHAHVAKSYIGMRATCLEPYHEHSHPISIIWEGKQENPDHE